MKEDVLFKKTPFGGFDRVEVISYIQQLKETQHKYKVMIDEKDVLNKKLTEDNVILARQVESLKNSLEEADRRLTQSESELRTVKTKYDMLEKRAGKQGDAVDKKLAGETVKMCDELVETASATAKEIVKNAENQLDGARTKIDSVIDSLEMAKKMPAKDVKTLLAKLSEELKNG